MTAALEGGEWSAACPGRTLPPGKTRYLFYRRLGGPQGQSGRAENLVPTGIRSRTVQPVVIPAELPGPRNTQGGWSNSVGKCRWNKMHYFLLIYFKNKLLHVSTRLAAHHQENQLCINSSLYSQQPLNITHDYTNCCLYRADSLDDEQQAWSKQVEVYCWNKLTVWRLTTHIWVVARR